MKQAVVLALVAAALSACSAPAELDNYAIPLSEGTRTIELEYVPLERRTDRIQLIEDLVIGERGDDLDYLFGRHAPKVAVDAEGRIYALDSGQHRIQVFSPEGEYLRTMGRRGEGPGEFQYAGVITVAGQVVVVSQPFGRGSTAWTLDGKYLYDLDIDAVPRRASGTGLADGTFVGSYPIPSMQGTTTVVAHRDSTGAEIHRYAELSGPVQMAYAVDPSGAVYVSTIQGARQQITAFTVDGEVRWAIRAPRTGPAPAWLKMGAGGDLYVSWTCGEDLASRCVDVFSPEGDRQVAGWMVDVNLDVGWQAADDEHVYGADRDPVSDEWRIVRYRLGDG